MRSVKKEEDDGISLTNGRTGSAALKGRQAFLSNCMAYFIPQEVFKESLWPIVIWKVNHLLNNDVKICYLHEH